MTHTTIVAVADTHGKHSHIAKIFNGDIFIHAGDFVAREQVHGILRFKAWLDSLPHRHKVVIAGNHDMLFEDNPSTAENLLGNSCIYLKDRMVTIEGINIYGSPWQPMFFNWAFNLPRNGEELKRKWQAIPDDVDILVTHSPPCGILDQCPAINNRSKLVSVGCELLAKEVSERIRPKIHIFGHIHEGSGHHIQEHPERIHFINASICNGMYQPVNPIRVIRLENDETRIVS